MTRWQLSSTTQGCNSAYIQPPAWAALKLLENRHFIFFGTCHCRPTAILADGPESIHHSALLQACVVSSSTQLFCLPVSASGPLVSSHAFNNFTITLPRSLFVACYFAAAAAVFPFFSVLPVSQSSCPSQLPWSLPSPIFHRFAVTGASSAASYSLQEITVIPAALHIMPVGGHLLNN